MSPPLTLQGIGWVTPLGNGLEEVWQRLMAGERAAIAELASPHGGGARKQFYVPVPPAQVEWLGRTPRIRRSSAITYFTVAAGLAALADAGLPLAPGAVLDPEVAARTAVIFAICSGGVNYTRRFYEKIVADGPPAASPLLFPETVYNAPASHLAALLGIDHASYTLVGDATVGISALEFAQELLASDPGLDRCVVVGGEESDWILCEAYASWRLLATEPCVRLHASPPGGMILGEGAAALVVGRGEGEQALRIATATASFTRRSNAGAALDTVLGSLPIEGSQQVIGSANGTWIDRVEAARLARHLPQTPTYYPKAALGEPLGASSLIQVAIGAMTLRRGEVPPMTDTPRLGIGVAPLGKVTVTALGLNQQAAGAVLTVLGL